MKDSFKNMKDNKNTPDKIRICDEQERLDFLLKNTEEITDGEVKLLNELKDILCKFNNDIQKSLPFRKYVWEKLQELNSYDAKIIFLKEVISLWEVNAINAEILHGDKTANGVKDEHIKLYSSWLTYFQRMKELEEEVSSINAYSENNNSKIDSNAVLSRNMLDKVYDQCNDYLWLNINKEKFKEMLVSGNIGLQIKSGNRQRVIALLNRISFTIVDEKAKSTWVANVERTLAVKGLSKIYKLDETNSKPNKKFNLFLDCIYSK